MRTAGKHNLLESLMVHFIFSFGTNCEHVFEPYVDALFGVTKHLRRDSHTSVFMYAWGPEIEYMASTTFVA